MAKGVLLFLVGVVSFNALGNSLSLGELREKLKRSGASWVAGEKETNRRLGAQLPEGFDEFFSGEPAERTELPAAFDWRNVDGVNYASPILNQASCGSCVAFAAVATMETQMNITRKTPYSPWQFSSQHLFSCGGGACEQGWTPYSALSFMKSKGVPDEACFPYAGGALGEDIACSNTCANASARSTKIVSSHQPTSFFLSIDAVKKGLEKGPLLAVMRVYEDFLFYKSGVYKHVTGSMAGGHAVSIVGWNDADKAWIVRNSWGEEWGEGGYFRIAYDDASGVGSQTYGVVVPDANGFVAVKGVRDHEVISGTVDLTLESTYANTQNVEWTMNRDGAPVWWGEGRGVSVDTTQFKDGTYTLVAKATHAAGVGESQPRTVHVLNGAFNGSLTFADIKEGDVVTEQRYLKIDVKHAPVPFTKIVFQTKHLATGEESTRSTFNSLPSIRFNWRAHLVAKGEYTLSLTGYVGKNVAVATVPLKVTVQ